MAARPSTSKRASTATSADVAGPTSCQIHPSAVVSDKTQITGKHSVEIGEGSVLHPYARIRADGGKVVIGKGCTVWENAEVGTTADESGHDVEIGDGVSIETGAVVEAKSIGRGSIVGIGAKVGRGARIGQVGEWQVSRSCARTLTYSSNARSHLSWKSEAAMSLQTSL